MYIVPIYFLNVAPLKWNPELTKLLIDEVHQRENSKVPKKKMFQEITAKLNKEKKSCPYRNPSDKQIHVQNTAEGI